MYVEALKPVCQFRVMEHCYGEHHEVGEITEEAVTASST